MNLTPISEAQHAHEHALKRFWRASDLPGGCGLGLGLAIVAEIARRHGGVASAHAVAPRGLVVRIRLPGDVKNQGRSQGRE